MQLPSNLIFNLVYVGWAERRVWGVWREREREREREGEGESEGSIGYDGTSCRQEIAVVASEKCIHKVN